ncbi:MAG: sulfotransferase [Gammaproteobacteria bacterium]|nr:sulfotransferase [Gammaproteobacteria bacterium]
MYARDWSWLILGGCPRSGTTVLNFTLNDHPAVRLTNEHNLALLIEKLEEVFYRERLLARWPEREMGPGENWHREDVRRATLRCAASLTPALRAIYESTFAGQVDLRELRYFGDKFPTYYAESFDKVRGALSPLTVIHVSRHPYAVIASMLRRTRNTALGADSWTRWTTLEAGCTEWARAWNFMQGLRGRGESPGFRCLHLRYEDLVAEPDQTCRRLQSFLGLEAGFDESRVRTGVAAETEPLVESACRRIREALPGIAENWNRPLAEIEATVGILPMTGGAADGNAPRKRLRSVSRLFGSARTLTRRLRGARPEIGPVPGGAPAVAGRDEILRYLLREYRFEDVLDIGCGTGGGRSVLVTSGKRVSGLDTHPAGDVAVLEGYGAFTYVQCDFRKFEDERRFDAVVCSHVIEHMPDTEAFLRQALSFLKPSGIFCIIWPPPKPTIVGGHVHVFNMGLMLYNLVRLGVDCRGVDMLRCGYSLAVVGRLRWFESPPLKNDAGDIESLSPWFPFPACQNFDGDNVPGIVDL